MSPNRHGRRRGTSSYRPKRFGHDSGGVYNKKIPRKIMFDKEYLYDQALQSKIENNNYKDQNKRNSVRMKYLEKELEKRDSVI